MAEERAMRESELEKIGAALSSMPARAGQAVTVGAAAVGFITSSAVMGNLKWYAALDSRWQAGVLCLAGVQIVLVAVALVLTLTVAPPDAVGLYEGPSPTATIVRKRKTWQVWKLIPWFRQPTKPTPSPIGFAEEARQKILAITGAAPVRQAQIDEYMAMIAFLKAWEDSQLLRQRRRTITAAAFCVGVAAVCAAIVILIAATARLGTSISEDNQSVPLNVIMSARPSHAILHAPDSDQSIKRGGAAPTKRRHAGALQRQGVRSSWPSNSSGSTRQFN